MRFTSNLRFVRGLVNLTSHSACARTKFCPFIHPFSTCADKKEQESVWESIVGLEIHAQINSKSKLFSGASTVFGAPTNTQVSYFDAALPGTLPVCNKHCVEAGVLTALALNSKVHKTSLFDRKHYFYSDLPAGYQITQQFQPLATDGHLEFFVYDSTLRIKPYKCKVRLKQLQLEQDSGRSFHLEGQKTLVDLNRAGIGLIELVFEPDIKNGLEAAMLVKELQLILTRLGTCTCVMEEGALRVDANISVHKPGEPWGVRTEVKNINSFKFVAKAIDFEINRQIKALEAGDVVYNETRSFDFRTKETVFMRDKEEFQDYRFFPEPNLPPLQLYDDSDVVNEESPYIVNIDDLKRKMPQLPSDDRHLLMTAYNLSLENADKIVKNGLLEFFMKVTDPGLDQDFIVKFLTVNVQHQLNQRKQTFQSCEITPEQVKELIELLHHENISEATSNDILEMLFNGDQRSAKEIVEAYNWFLLTDENDLKKYCLEVIAERHNVAKKYRNTRKQRYMTSLLAGLNSKVNNRASVKDAEAVFVKLIINNSEK